MSHRIRSRSRFVDLRATASQEAIAASVPNDPNDGLALEIVYRAPSELTSGRRRLRKPNKRQDTAIRAAITKFGNLNPILIDADGRIICGEARWRAAMDLGLDKVPTTTVAHLNEVQLRLYRIAETRIVELSEWDEEALKLEFAELSNLDLGLDFSLELTGFSTSEIDNLLIETDHAESDSPLRFSHAPVCRRGETWQLGDHRLHCGDALIEQSYKAVMGDEKAQIVFCDAPYNQPMRNISSADFEEFAMGSGEMSREEFTGFLTSAFGLMANYSVDGAIHYQCMDWSHQHEMLNAGEAVYTKLRNLVVWNKGTGGQGSFYRSQYELIYVWQVGNGKPINNFGLGETGRYRTNVWDYRGNNSFHADREEELARHPTVKPVPLIADALRDCSHRGGIVLDAFGGSGSTLLAAEYAGRRARLIEIEPGYCDVTIERWQAKTGREAIHIETGYSWLERATYLGIEVHGSPDGEDREAE